LVEQRPDLGDLIGTEVVTQAGHGGANLYGVAEADQDGGVGSVVQDVAQAQSRPRVQSLAVPRAQGREACVERGDVVAAEHRVGGAVILWPVLARRGRVLVSEE
jgi:hypothetical protein